MKYIIKNKTCKRILPALLCVLVLMAMFPVQAFAVGLINPNQDATLTIEYAYDAAALKNAEFDIYRVADVATTPVFTVDSTFATYPIATEGLDAVGWNTLATTLKGYVQADNITPDFTGKTGEDGKFSFTMKPGLYLIVGKVLSQGGYSYTSTPSVVCLPDRDDVANTWNYAVTVKPKAQRTANSSPYVPPTPTDPTKPTDPTDPTEPVNPETITKKVLKVWDDHGYTSEIPKSVKVTLLCDGEKYETVTLSQKNNWRHTWKALPSGHDWSIVEKEVKGYTVKVTEEGQSFVVTNTNEKPPVTPENPQKPDTGKRLPQTGMLWWPVPILLMGGALLLALGIHVRRRNEDE